MTNIKIHHNYKAKIASLSINDREYDLIIPNPAILLQYENISWEAKGYICYMALTSSKDFLPTQEILEEIIKCEFLIESTGIGG
jgi:hypothetical protein